MCLGFLVLFHNLLECYSCCNAQTTSLGGSSSSSASSTLGLLTDPLPEVKQSLAAALKVLAQWEAALADFMRDWVQRWQSAKFVDAGTTTAPDYLSLRVGLIHHSKNSNHLV